MSAEEEVLDQEAGEEQEGDKEFPPETAQLLSWSSLRFIRAPSSDFLMWSIVAIALTIIAILMMIFRNLQSTDTSILSKLKW